MDIRLRIEEIERKVLSKYATLSSKTKGRKIKEDKCEIRTDFQRDRDRIIHSKAFRRLKHKTQVFIAPEGDHYRTRLTHTLEVAQISRTISKSLGLNEDLTEAIALGHDLGHTPFGHTGENVLNRLHSKGFRHNEQSLRVVDFLEHNSKKHGLNLTYEVRNGIHYHTGKKGSESLEGVVVGIADRIAYINHDIDDAVRAGIISLDELPKDCVEVLGKDHGNRINTMILDIIRNSMNKKQISMSKKTSYYTNKLRSFMFDQVYLDNYAKSEEKKAEYIIEELYRYYFKYPDKLSYEHRRNYIDEEFLKEDMVCDYIAGMTDRYAINSFSNIFMPKAWKKY